MEHLQGIHKISSTYVEQKHPYDCTNETNQIILQSLPLLYSEVGFVDFPFFLLQELEIGYA